MADPYLAEAAATTGYDWLLIDGEHAPNDLRSTLGAAPAAVAPHRPAGGASRGRQHSPDQADAGHRVKTPLVPHGGHGRPGPGHRGRHAIPAPCAASAVPWDEPLQWSSRADYLNVADDEVFTCWCRPRPPALKI
jgi:4-hydroxy-2-oxoheptanedioate aldolase